MVQKQKKEQSEAEERSSPSGAIVYKAILMEAQEELARPFGNYLAPTIIGNIIGGVALVAAINHAQVVSGRGGVHTSS